MKLVTTVLALVLVTSVASAQSAKPTPPAKPQAPAKPAPPPARTRKLPFKPAFPYFVSVNGGYQPTKNDFQDSASFSEQQETARIDASYEVLGAPGVNIVGGAYVWRRLAVGVGVTRFTTATAAAVSASFPHPFFFSQPRVINQTIGMDRTETAVHLSARALIPTGRRFEVAVFGGPSFFNVTQGVVTDVTYTHVYPYDIVTLGSTATVEGKASKTGFHAGADVGYFFTRQVGAGFTAQIARTQVDVPGARGSEQTIDAGGLQLGAGVRVRF